MNDGFKETDKELAKLERRIKKEYKAAYDEMKKKTENYFKRFEQMDRQKKKLVDQGRLNRKDYLEWRRNKMLSGKYYEEMVDNLAQELSKAREKAQEMIYDTEPKIYAMGANYAQYEAEIAVNADIGFTLVNEEAVRELIKSGDVVLPKPSISISKELRWNTRKLNSALLTGILTGDSIPNLAKRLRSVTNMSKSASIRNARTLVNGAENLGHLNKYKEAKELGIKVKNEWRATHDSRTRLSHRMLDGTIKEVGEEFLPNLTYPGDPNGDPSEIYNCRCRLVAVIEGYKYADIPLDTSKMDAPTYEEWKHTKPNYSKKKKKKR